MQNPQALRWEDCALKVEGHDLSKVSKERGAPVSWIIFNYPWFHPLQEVPGMQGRQNFTLPGVVDMGVNGRRCNRVSARLYKRGYTLCYL